MKFTLAHKMILVVAVPVLFQLAYLAFLTSALGKFAQMQANEQKQTAVLSVANRLYMDENERYLFYGMYRATLKEIYKQKFFQVTGDMRSAFQSLSDLWKDSPDKISALNNSRRGADAMSRFGAMMMQGEKQETVSDLLGGEIGMYLLNQMLAMHSKGNLERLLERDQRLQSDAEKLLGESEQDIRNFLIIGLVASVILSAGCGLFFSASVSRRLKRIVNNIELMSERSNELHPMSGSDEIAALNEAVEYTAKKIREGEEFQAQTIRIIADELEEPLKSVANTFVTLRKTGFVTLTEKGEARLRDSNREISRLRTLVNELSLLERNDVAEHNLEIQRFDLRSIAQSAISIIDDFALSRSVQVVLKDSNNRDVVGDPNRILQVVVNLLSNAIKFSSSKSQVEVELSEFDNLGRLTVVDHGPGIEDEFKSRIFKRYEQNKAADAIERGGSGLGLVISKEILEAQHGTMGFRSKLGVGSSFWLDLPIADACGGSADELHPPAPPETKTERRWKSTLWTQGVAVVMLPLLVQAITIIILWFVLGSVGANIADYNRAAKIADIHSKIMVLTARCTFYSMLFNASQERDTLEKTKLEQNKLKAQLALLREVTSDNVELASKTEELSHMIDAHLKLEQDLITAPANAHAERWFGPKNAEATETLLIQMQKPLQESIQHERELIENRTLASQGMRRDLDLVLLSSAIVTGIASAALGLFMVRKLTSRVYTLLEHTQQFSENKIIVEPCDGSDEIAYVDFSFYNSAQKLRELERFKAEMVPITSHELRTPLTSLMALTELIENSVFGELTDEGREILRIAQINITELIVMITNLLDLEKMQVGKILIAVKEIDIDEVLLAAKENSSAFESANAVEVKVALSGLMVEADRARLIQALTAVLHVLVKKLPENSVVKVSAERYKKGIKLTLAVPFQSDIEQADTLTGDIARERLAIGLARLIVEQHGGSLTTPRIAGGRLINLVLPNASGFDSE